MAPIASQRPERLDAQMMSQVAAKSCRVAWQAAPQNVERDLFRYLAMENITLGVEPYIMQLSLRDVQTSKVRKVPFPVLLPHEMFGMLAKRNCRKPLAPKPEELSAVWAQGAS